MTNFERITQSPDELAKFLVDCVVTCDYCIVKDFCRDHWELNGCEETFKAWLNQ